MKNILITGGAGFIGSHLVKYFVNNFSDYHIINLDKLTYAGNTLNLKEIDGFENYTFINEDICDYENLLKIFSHYNISHVIHLAAESHVDRSISNPFQFAHTNVIGTLSLLNAAKVSWQSNYDEKFFYHISTDEVYGSLGNTGFFSEKTPYNPHSPYSASKASSDHFVRAYFDTYQLPIKISNCSNNYGPYQYPEKLIPLFILNIYNKKTLPLYGSGKNIRDWLHVDDHISAIDTIFHSGKIGETYNIGSSNELSNLELVQKLISLTDEILGRKKNFSLKFLKHVDDRLGHDFRYAIDSSKISKQLNWKPKINFDIGINQTINWYIENIEWVKKLS